MSDLFGLGPFFGQVIGLAVMLGFIGAIEAVFLSVIHQVFDAMGWGVWCS